MNELCINALYHSFYGETDELWHKGTDGMHWGRRYHQPYSQGYQAQRKGIFYGTIGKLRGLTSKAKDIGKYYTSGEGGRDLMEGFSQLGGKARSFGKKVGSGYADAARQLASVGSEYARRGKAGISRIGKKASWATSDLYKGIKGAGTPMQTLEYLLGEGKKKVDAGSKFIESMGDRYRRRLSDINEQNRANGITPRQALQQAISGISSLRRSGQTTISESILPTLSDINQTRRTVTRSENGTVKPALGLLGRINEAESNKQKRYSMLSPEGREANSRVREAFAEISDYRDPNERKAYDSGLYSMSKYAKSLLPSLGDINQGKKTSRRW